MIVSEFIEKIEKFLAERSMSASEFGMEAISNPNFVYTLRKGGSCTLHTAQKVLDFMNSHKNRCKTCGGVIPEKKKKFKSSQPGGENERNYNKQMVTTIR